MINKNLARWRIPHAWLLFAALSLTAEMLPARPAQAADPAVPPSDRLKINLGASQWKYMRSDKPGTSIAAKEVASLPAHPEAVTIDESAWQTVGIPRAVGQSDMFINMESGGGQGQLAGNVAWYRKHISATMLPASYQDRKVMIEVEGSHTGAVVYVNGVKVPSHSSAVNPNVNHVVGFLPFMVDITPYITFGQENVVAIKVIKQDDEFNDPHFSGAFRFGQGDSGLFRPVQMVVTNKVHIPLNVWSGQNTWGTHVSTVSIDEINNTALVQVETNVLNETGQPQDVTLTTRIVDATGKVVAESQDARTVAPNTLAFKDMTPTTSPNTTVFTENLTVDKPILWYPNNSPDGGPYMYRVIHIVSQNGRVLDTAESPLGIRTITWDANFPYINGKQMHLWGASGRYDYPALGTGVPEELQWRDLQLLKDAGGNLYRPGHSSSSSEFVEAADALGIFVVQPSGEGEGAFSNADGCYGLTAPTADQPGQPGCTQGAISRWDLKAELHRELVIRDRNHPSILAWEADNGPIVTEFAQRLKQITQQWDPVNTRAQADRTPDDANGDILGCSRQGCEDGVKAAHPDKPAWSAEYWGAGEFREGWDYQIAMVASFLNDWHNGVAAGAFGMAHWYLADTPGETSTSFSGSTDRHMRSLGSSMVDGNRLPKLLYHAYHSLWTPLAISPVVALDHHWNRAGLVTVNAFSNCEKVRLLVNGQVQGEDQTPNPIDTPNITDLSETTTSLPHQVHWSNVQWQAGTVAVQCMDQLGNVVQVNGAGQVVQSGGTPVQDTRTTTGPADHIVLEQLPAMVKPNGEAFQVTANGSDVAIITAKIVDKAGNVVPEALGHGTNLTFSVVGDAEYRGGWDHINDAQGVNLDAPVPAGQQDPDATLSKITYHSPESPELATEGGLTRIAVRARFTTGAITVKAVASDGSLAPASTVFTIAPVPVVANADALPPQIVVQPQSQTVSVGQPPVLSVETSAASAGLTFQWLRNNVAIAGATSASYTAPAALQSDNGSVYAVKVHNQFGDIQSDNAVLTVVPAQAPLIQQQPLSQNVLVGQSVTFQVAVQASPPITYQWLRNGAIINGATGVSYTIAAVTADLDGSQYSVLVSNPVNKAGVPSSPATLSVGAAVPLTITSQPVNVVAGLNHSATFTVATSGSGPVHYKWSKDNQTVGTDSATFQIQSVGVNDYGNYVVTVSNPAGDVTSNVAALVQAPPGVNLALNKRAYTPTGGDQDSQGMPPGNVVDGNPLSRWASVQKKDDAYIDIDLGAPMQFNRMILRWEAAYASAYQIKVSNDGVNFDAVPPVHDETAGKGGVDDFAFPITTARYIRMQGVKRAGDYGYSLFEIEVYNVAACGTADERYSAIPGSNGLIKDNLTGLTWTRIPFTLNSANGEQFTQLKAQAYCATQSDAQGNAMRLATKNEALAIAADNYAVCAFPNAWSSWTTTVDPTNAQNAFIVSSSGDTTTNLIDNFPGSALCVSGTAQVLAPSITVQPVNQSAVVGAVAHFAVGSKGTPPLTYEWFRNGVSLGSSNSAFYDTPVLALADSGAKFHVIVTNAAGQNVTSADAVLTVTAASTGGNGGNGGNGNGAAPLANIVTPPFNQSVAVGQSATFTVIATAPDAITYQWQRGGQNIANATGASYTTPAATLADDGAQYTVIVHNGGGDVASLAATLSVIDGPAADDTHNLALKKTVTASGSEDNPPFVDPGHVVDGDLTTRWSSNYAADAWVTVDLGAEQQINGVDLVWENAFGKQYLIQTSLDGVNFDNTVYTQHAGRGGEENLTFNITSARYVRMQGVERNTQYGYSLWEFKVFAPQLGFVTQPAAQIVTAGQSAHFQVAAAGPGPYTFQWLKNGAVVATSTDPFYDTPATTVADSGALYSVVVQNGVTAVASNTALLTVNPAAGSGSNGNAGGLGGNLALGKRAIGSAVENPGFGALANAIDGKLDTRWSSAFVDDAWMGIDMGVPTAMSQVTLRWEASYGAAYEIQVSDDGVNWSRVASQPAGQGGVEQLTFDTVTKRYIRLQGITRHTQYGYSLFEFEVYGPAGGAGSGSASSGSGSTGGSSGGSTAPVGANLAIGKATLGSAVENPGFGAWANAVDGKLDTRWSSAFVDNAWMGIDLGAPTPLSQVILRWENSYGVAYEIQVSDDAVNWDRVYAQNAGQGGVEQIAFTPVTKRYIRLLGVTRSSQYGYSLYEFEVYGPAAGSGGTGGTGGTTPTPPVIGTAPASITVTAGQSAHFAVVASGTAPFTYQWYKGGQPIAGATAAGYDTPATVSADSGAVFTVKVTDANGQSVTSSGASLTVNVASGNGSGSDYTVYPGFVGIDLQNNTRGVFTDDQVYVAVIARDDNNPDPGNPGLGRFSYLKPDGTIVPANVSDNDAPGHLTKNGHNYSNYFFTLAQYKQMKLPPMSSGRIFVSLGSPLFITINTAGDNSIGFAGPDLNNPNDPNTDVKFDWYEFTYGAPNKNDPKDNGTMFINTTQVDQFGIPMTLDVYGTNHTFHAQTGITETHDAIVSEYLNDVPDEFKGTVNPMRILAPAKSTFNAGQQYGQYFDAYINEAWDYYRTHPLVIDLAAGRYAGLVQADDTVVFNQVDKVTGKPVSTAQYIMPGKPSTQNVLEGSGPLALPGGGANPDVEKALEVQICAAFNRHTVLDTTQWSAPTPAWYSAAPANFYAQFWHKHSINGLAYGFAYDDAENQSSSIIGPSAEHMVLGIGW
jgi:hypothetical protein